MIKRLNQHARITALIVAFSICAPTILAGNQTPGFIPNRAKKATTKPATQTKQATPTTAPEKRYWNLENADIRAIIAAISKETGKNFIVDPHVKGKVSIVSSTPIAPKEAYQVFLSALQMLGFAAVPSGDLIKIVPDVTAKGLATTVADNKNPGKGDELVVRVIAVNFVSAIQLVPILRPLVPQWGNITAYAPSNTLLLAGRANNVQRLATIIRSVDRADSSRVIVIHPRFGSAVKIVKVLNSLQNANRATGKISNVSLVADPQSNTILVSGNKADRLRMRVLISQLDSQGSQSGANTIVIHIKYLDAKKLAAILAKIANSAYSVTEGSVTTNPGNTAQPTTTTTASVGDNKNVAIQADEDANALIISAPASTLQSLKAVVRQLDQRPAQVLIEAVIAQVDENMLQDLGITWGTRSTTGGDTSNSLTDAATGFQIGVGILKHGSIRVLVSALLNNTSSDLLATPSIMVLNNKKANIVVGKNIGMKNREYSTDTSTTDGNNVPFNNFERKDVALTLTVTPHITPNNVVRLSIEQRNDTLQNPTDPSDNPIINTSHIKTTVLVRNGDVLVLGGLISHDLEAKVNKVPILGDIPLLGNLFKSSNKTLEKKNLMIFLRPIVLTKDEVGPGLTHDRYDFMRNLELRRRRGQTVITNIGETPLLRTNEKSVKLPQPF